MSAIPPAHENRRYQGRRDKFESMTRREQLWGTIAVMLVLLLAIVLRSL